MQDEINLDRLVRRMAWVCSSMAWVLTAHAGLNHYQIEHLTVAPLTALNMIGLVSGMLGTACAAKFLAGLKGDWGDYLFFFYCGAPFVLMISLLDPLGASSSAM